MRAPTECGAADRVLTLPNAVTTVRLLCIPVFVVLLTNGDRLAAALLLAGLGATDWVDGQLARRLHQVSTVGKILDPTADRLLLGVGVVAIMIDGSVPLWIGIAVLAREVLVAGAALVLAAAGARRIDVQWVGKAGTMGLMFAFPLFLLSHAGLGSGLDHAARWAAWGFALAGLCFSYYAAVTYIPLARRALIEGRAGRAASDVVAGS
ncbi:MAG: CDP-alcohol phosphatidyltransferase family protein [Acidimicrobiales bacterium]